MQPVPVFHELAAERLRIAGSDAASEFRRAVELVIGL